MLKIGLESLILHHVQLSFILAKNKLSKPCLKRSLEYPSVCIFILKCSFISKNTQLKHVQSELNGNNSTLKEKFHVRLSCLKNLVLGTLRMNLVFPWFACLEEPLDALSDSQEGHINTVDWLTASRGPAVCCCCGCIVPIGLFTAWSRLYKSRFPFPYISPRWFL